MVNLFLVYVALRPSTTALDAHEVLDHSSKV